MKIELEIEEGSELDRYLQSIIKDQEKTPEEGREAGRERILFLDEQKLCNVRIASIVHTHKTTIYPQGAVEIYANGPVGYLPARENVHTYMVEIEQRPKR